MRLIAGALVTLVAASGCAQISGLSDLDIGVDPAVAEGGVDAPVADSACPDGTCGSLPSSWTPVMYQDGTITDCPTGYAKTPLVTNPALGTAPPAVHGEAPRRLRRRRDLHGDVRVHRERDLLQRAARVLQRRELPRAGDRDRRRRRQVQRDRRLGHGEGREVHGDRGRDLYPERLPRGDRRPPRFGYRLLPSLRRRRTSSTRSARSSAASMPSDPASPSARPSAARSSV